MDESEKTRIIASILAGHANDQYGLKPYDPGVNFPQDVGLGGLSTEYVATEYDPQGQLVNYPQVWYDTEGRAKLLEPDQAYAQAMAYENGSKMSFPRFDSLGNASVFASHRSTMGGAENAPLASFFGFRNFK